jgi:molybdopterin molybdotransferase
MKPLSEARAEILAAVPRLASGTIDVDGSVGRITAQAAVAREYSPPFDNSAMDGYAVVASDWVEAPLNLRVNEDTAAGSVPTMRVVSGTATRIMTGAPIPEGADAVVPVENTESQSRDGV